MGKGRRTAVRRRPGQSRPQADGAGQLPRPPIGNALKSSVIMSGRGTYYVTTPIYYVNDVPHIGHAYTTLACDVLARFMRLDGRDVHFLTGTDEHGQKVEKAAAAAGLAPQAFADKVSQSFRDLVKTMNYSPDNFIRTTEPRHHAASQALWEKLLASGDIYLGNYSGWYSVRDEAYFVEGETEVGTDGKRRATSSGAEVEWVEEPSYFFKLSTWADRLLEFYDKNPRFIAPESRRNEVISFVKGGLQDLSVSRTSFSWGVPVPGDPKHIMYVWLDALTNYITECGYPDTGNALWRYWPAERRPRQRLRQSLPARAVDRGQERRRQGAGQGSDRRSRYRLA